MYNVSVWKDLSAVVQRLSSVDIEQIPKTIIFVQTKNMTCKLYSFLRKSTVNKKSVNMYHASLTAATKTELYNSFCGNGPIRCLVSTIAFGMVQSL